ncbi:MAG: M20 metallopeptidase family protein [Actinomycetota bacterium]
MAEALGSREGRRVAGTGLLVPADRGPGGVVVRAELDGLPIEEESGAPFAATGGRMHACGHDVHMAALVAVVRAARRADLPVPLMGLFQPSEENYPSGAAGVVEEGALEEAGAAAVVAAHVHPDVRLGAVTADAGAVNASADNFRIVVEGTGGHAAYPHRIRDPVLALAQTVVALQQVVSRRSDPMGHTVFSVTSVRAGAAPNVIPGSAEGEGTFRVLDPEDRKRLVAAVEEVVDHTARAHGCTARVEITEGEPSVVNDAALARSARRMLAEVGFDVGPTMRSCGSDDFGYYGRVATTLMLFVGVGDRRGERTHPLHHPEFLPPDEAVAAVARAQAAAYSGAVAALAGGIED